MPDPHLLQFPKKLSNNSVIEIDSCSPLELLKLQMRLKEIAEQENIMFVSGKGKKKPEIQLLYEELENCGKRLMEYKDCFEIMGRDHSRQRLLQRKKSAVLERERDNQLYKTAGP